jgi:predicted PurR-regulated permease PerM
MNKNIDLKSVNLKPLLKKYSKKFGRHAIFGAIVTVLLVYVLVVFKINTLANAEPAPDQTITVTTLIPRIDKDAINQIQSLEENNTEVHSLFEAARNNPFQE